MGAAYGFLAGNVAASVGRWVAFLAVVQQYNPKPDSMHIGSDSNSAMAIRVIQQFTQSSVDRGWVVEQLDEGGQAIVYAVTSRNQQPVWQAYRSLVIKLYKPSAATNAEVVRRQFEALSRLRMVLHGHAINGWRIYTPAPLYVCLSPLALVMTMVPGRPLSSLLGDADNTTPELLDCVPRTVVAASVPK